MSSKRPRAAPPKAEQHVHGERDASSDGAGQAPMMSAREVAKFLNVSERHIAREIRYKRLAAHHFGRLVRIASADLEIYVAARRRGPR